ncbi:hypothetical protein N9095_00170 [bacterium]|nr:hypothetical protein [bacterium]
MGYIIKIGNNNGHYLHTTIGAIRIYLSRFGFENVPNVNRSNEVYNRNGYSIMRYNNEPDFEKINKMKPKKLFRPNVPNQPPPKRRKK